MTEQPFVSSRFLIKEKPLAYPNYDLILQDSQGPVFDLNVEMNGYDGAVYLRTDHVIEMGRTLGMATVEEVQLYKDTIAALRNQISTIQTQEAFKSELIGILDRARDIISPAPVEPEYTLDDIPLAEPDDTKPAEAERKTIGSIVL